MLRKVEDEKSFITNIDRGDDGLHFEDDGTDYEQIR